MFVYNFLLKMPILTSMSVHGETSRKKVWKGREAYALSSDAKLMWSKI